MRLLSFGSNGLGQLGLGHDIDARVPVEVQLPSEARVGTHSIAAGGNHTLLLNEREYGETHLYAAGDNSVQQCGVKKEDLHLALVTQETSFKNFRLVPPPNKVDYWRLVSAGWTLSVLVSSSNKIFACGQGFRGELGLGALNNAHYPVEIPDFPPKGTTVKQIHSSVSHTVIVLSNQTVYGWGVGRKGQLGLPNTPEIRCPRQIKLPVGFNAAKAVCGRTFTAIIDIEGQVLVLGDDRFSVVTDAPKQPLPNWKDTGAGWSAVYVLLTDGTIVAWGKNTHGQLPPNGLPPIETLAVGSEHVIAVEKESGNVYAWGWGEHGNCGTGDDMIDDNCIVRTARQVKINTSLNGSSENNMHTVKSVAAGCATSWISII